MDDYLAEKAGIVPASLQLTEHSFGLQEVERLFQAMKAGDVQSFSGFGVHIERHIPGAPMKGRLTPKIQEDDRDYMFAASRYKPRNIKRLKEEL